VTKPRQAQASTRVICRRARPTRHSISRRSSSLLPQPFLASACLTPPSPVDSCAHTVRCPCQECAVPSATRHPLRSVSTNATPAAESLTSWTGRWFAVALLTLHGRACLYLYEQPLDDEQRIGAIGNFTEGVRGQTGSLLEEHCYVARIDEVCRHRHNMAKGFLRSHAGRWRGRQRLLRWATSSHSPMVSPPGARPT
jgi:hypothetical protein